LQQRAGEKKNGKREKGKKGRKKLLILTLKDLFVPSSMHI
jgi:hypothetical protein